MTTDDFVAKHGYHDCVAVDGKSVSLIAAFKAARAAAEAAGSNDEDGGTCNFDSPAFLLPRVRKEKVKAAAEAAGCDAADFKWRGRQGWYWLCGIFKGQGNRRTRMAEAACAALKAEGLKAQMYYQMD